MSRTEDALGPKYADIEKTWALPADQMRGEIRKAVSEAGFREEFLNAVRPGLVDRIPPDLWRLHWSLATPRRVEAMVDLIAGPLVAQHLYHERGLCLPGVVNVPG
ncbi:hypothetical protein [Luteimonas sp. R10]|uniref:hypothetical protein n=1 Tax=Luteimonas sp. R10 TaxID=3108176 RepID=UPI0030908867|nr:hypothetical protein U3649_09755 [Luteimonas sp. R10]